MSSQAVVAQEDKELQIMLKLADSEGVSKFLYFFCFLHSSPAPLQASA